MTPQPETDPAAGLGGRLPLLRPPDLNVEQQKLYKYLEDSKITWANTSGFQAELPDGRLIGPFNAFLYSPQLGRGFNEWIDAETQYTSLPAPVRQLIVLTVGAAWQAAYEVYAHTAVGRAAGLSAAVMKAIKQGQEPAGLPAPEAAVYRFTQALVTQQQVPDDRYRAAVAAFGPGGVVDMVHLIGQYLATSALLNAFAVPAPKA